MEHFLHEAKASEGDNCQDRATLPFHPRAVPRCMPGPAAPRTTPLLKEEGGCTLLQFMEIQL